MNKFWASMGKLASGVVIILGVLILSGAVFSFDYGVNSFTPAIYDSGFSQFGGDAYTYIGNNAAAVAAHVNNLYKTTVKLSGIFMIILGTVGVCLFGVLGGEESKPATAYGQKPEAVPTRTPQQTPKAATTSTSQSVSYGGKMENENVDLYKENSEEEIGRDVSSVNLADANVGDTVLFGMYQQEPSSNKKTDIEWLVIDKQENSIALLSKYILDCQPYNTTPVDVSWENSTLREWLNDTFYHTAFNEHEQRMIQDCFAAADSNPRYGTSYDNDTEDKVFLLSAKEVEELLSENIISHSSIPTKTLRKYWNEIGEGKGWWLRSPGTSLARAMVFDKGAGSIDYKGNYVNYFSNGVRPALRITKE